MNIDFFNTFLTVMQNKSFTKTAIQTNLSQSTVSNRITELEKHFQCQLFIRKSSSIEPTQAGLDLVDYAEQILATFNQARLSLEETRTVSDIEIASVHAFYDHYLSPIIQTSLTKEERLKVYLKHSFEIIQGLVSGRYKIGISHHACHYNHLKSELFLSEDLVFVSRLQSDNYEIHYSELSQLSIYHTNLFEKYFEDIIFLSNAYDLSLDIASKVLPLLLSNDAFAFLPRHMVKDLLETGHLFEYHIKDYDVPSLDYYLIYAKDLEKDLLYYLETIKDCK